MRCLAFLAVMALAVASVQAGAQPPPTAAAPASQPEPAPDRDAELGIETFRLWSGRAPSANGDGPDEVPTITVFRPQFRRAPGASVIVAPGGGYVERASVLEGRDVAAWFTDHGITAFVLTYRVGPKARLPIPLIDGARAVRFVRANAERFGITPDRIGMIGFSAGGHLVASVAGAATAGDPGAADPVERVSSRPDFVVLGYPWLEGMAMDATGQSQYCLFARKDCDPRDYVQYRPVNAVTDSFPPTFIYHTTSDHLVNPAGSIAFYQALLAHHVPAELHLFARGEHGTGLGGSDAALGLWPALLGEWLRGLGLFDPQSRAMVPR